ncbi:MAG: hypothetical protein JST75_09200 [Bacteroidetes bacterium]|nr:hypothetical protein [Bacteroidota bacterium]
MKMGWTILFYVCAIDSETKKYAMQLYDELSSIKYSDNLILLAFEGWCVDSKKLAIQGNLYELEFRASDNKRHKKSLKNFEIVNIGSAALLRQVLTDVKSGGYLLEHFLLFTWDHGAGFGIFWGEPYILLSTQPTQRLVVTASDPVIQEPLEVDWDFGAIRKKVYKPNMLTVTEIKEALSSLGKKTDLIIMMNCFMQMIETGYELCEQVDYLVAPESVDFFKGYDYNRILNEIVKNPEISAKSLATIAVKTIETRFESDLEWKKCLNELVVSSADLGVCNNLIEILNTAFSEILSEVEDRFDIISLLRTHCIDFSKGYLCDDKGNVDSSVLDFYIDLLYFLALLNEIGIVSDPTFNQVKESYSSYIFASFVGNNFENEFFRSKTRLGNGFSIFHPNFKNDFSDTDYYEYFYQSGRIKMSKTLWGDYLSAYKKKSSHK